MVNNVRELIIKDFIPNNNIRPSDVKMVDILWKPTDDQNVYVVKSIKRAPIVGNMIRDDKIGKSISS